MKRVVLAIALALGLLAGGCGEEGTGGAEASRLYQVWFVRDGRLFVSWRTGEETPRVGRAALERLLAGPTAAETDAGVSTDIPPGTQLVDLAIEDGEATVDLTSEFGSTSSSPRFAQVVFTLTQFETVRRVNVRIDGRPALPKPVARDDYEDLLPQILVEFPPLLGERVSSPVRLSGTADVFEATVLVRILDAKGEEIAETFTTASCGTGCRGKFSVDVPYTSPRDQRGTIVVSDSDADGDGKPQHEVRFPVLLSQET